MEIQRLENKKWQSWYRWTVTGLRECTAAPFKEPCILLQIAGTVQPLPAVI
jgi:hypothetical protein